MIRTKLLSLFSTAQYFRPNFDLNFDAEGRLLLYSTPSATVMFIKTFLKFYVPINAGFILVHTYFSLAEFMFPLIPGKSTYLIMSNCMIAIGIGMAAGTEIFARRFIKNIYLMSDGKTLSVEFHKAFSIRNTQMSIDIDNCIGLDEIFSRNYKLSLKNGKSLYMSFDRNEITDENSLLLLNKVINGQKINTLGNKNINKLFKKTNY